MQSLRHYIKAILYVSAFVVCSIALNLLGAMIMSYNPWILPILFCVLFGGYVIHVVANIVAAIENKS